MLSSPLLIEHLGFYGWLATVELALIGVTVWQGRLRRLRSLLLGLFGGYAGSVVVLAIYLIARQFT